MKEYVSIDTNIWRENEFTPITGLSYLWFISNGIYNNNIGCYEFSERVMSFYTGLSIDELKVAFRQLNEMDLIRVIDGEVLILNEYKNWTSSPMLIKKLYREIDKVKNKDFKDYLLEKIMLIQTTNKPSKMRDKVFQKYNGHCAYCGGDIDIKYFHIDHIMPKKSGGSNDLENLNPTCSKCNLEKNNRTLEEYRYFIDKTKSHKFYFEEI